MIRVALCSIFLSLAGSARGETHTYVLAIGNNAAPPAADGEGLEPLRYADDDAADFFSFTRELSRESILLTVFDRASLRRFPELADTPRPPTLDELRKAVARLRVRLEADRVAGHDAVLLFFFSGHGTRGLKGAPALALLDGHLTQEVLYNEVLAVLPARYVHLFVDACHAEAVVRPRDLDAQVVELGAEGLEHYAASSSLARFPNVGAIVATTSAAQSHEWEVYQRGVFSHEVLSGLRGGADVNNDGRVEYSELSAFLGAANRDIADERARLSVLVRPPGVNRRAVIVDVTTLSALRLTGRPSQLGKLYIEDELGNRLLDLHTEAQHHVTLVLPLGRRLFVHHARGEAWLPVAGAQALSFETILFTVPKTSARGAMDSALQRGLFVTPFGVHYYRGFVDKDQDLAPVDMAPSRAAPLAGELPSLVAARPLRRPALALMGTGAVLSVAALTLSAFCFEALAAYSATDIERPASQASDRAITFGVPALTTLSLAVVAIGVGAWLWKKQRSPAPTSSAHLAQPLALRW